MAKVFACPPFEVEQSLKKKTLLVTNGKGVKGSSFLTSSIGEGSSAHPPNYKPPLASEEPITTTLISFAPLLPIFSPFITPTPQVGDLMHNINITKYRIAKFIGEDDQVLSGVTISQVARDLLMTSHG
ncbi:hypothetical protein U1Q18_027793, partial [Sarracenia purpurea var. burkii]